MILSTDLVLRTSAKHWGHLTELLAAFERCVEACGRLDAHRALLPRSSYVQLRAFDARLARLTAMVDREVDRVTAERLLADLTAKMKREAA